MEKAQSEEIIKSGFFSDIIEISDETLIDKLEKMVEDKTLSLSCIDSEINLTEKKLEYLQNKIRILQNEMENETNLYKAMRQYNKENMLTSNKVFKTFAIFCANQKQKISLMDNKFKQFEIFLKELLSIRNNFINIYPQSEKSPVSPREVLKHSPRRSSPLRTSQTLVINLSANIIKTSLEESSSEEEKSNPSTTKTIKSDSLTNMEILDPEAEKSETEMQDIIELIEIRKSKKKKVKRKSIKSISNSK